MGKAINDMTQDERLVFFATGKKITTRKVFQLENKELKHGWVGRLRGYTIGKQIFETKEAAHNNVKNWRARLRIEAEAKGLIL